MSFNTISVVGLGYIGLPTAAIIASKKKRVIGVDISHYAVDIINSGGIHIVEPQLDLIVKEAVQKGFLRAVLSPEPADVFMIAVPTPFLPIKHKGSVPEPDLSFIESAVKAIAKVLKKGDLVILESTSPVGTSEQVAAWFADIRQDLTFPQTHGEDSDIRIAYCPERVLPGHVVRELVENDRIIGGMTEACSKAAANLYNIFVEGDCLVTNARTAEMVKLTENASRDVGIAFANELSVICDGSNIDTLELITLANRHPRVNILQPGCGVGGHCIAVDPWFIVSQNPLEAKLIRTARQINDDKPTWVVNKIKAAVEDFITKNSVEAANEVSIACYGLAFKPDIDDLRESPALEIARDLGTTHPGRVFAVEPNIKTYDGVEFDLVDTELALKKADIHVFLVKHTQFYGLNLGSQTCIDVCGLFHGN